MCGGSAEKPRQRYCQALEMAHLRASVPRLRGVRLPKTVVLRAFMVSTQETAMLPVRSAIFKQDTGGLVVRWVTTGEYPLLYVFEDFYF
jgi:hypothetical protein